MDNYNKYLSKLNLGLKLPYLKDKFKSSWAQYTVILPDDINRELLQEKLKLKNVPTAVYYPIPLNEHKPYNQYPVSKAGLETTYKLSKTVF